MPMCRRRAVAWEVDRRSRCVLAYRTSGLQQLYQASGRACEVMAAPSHRLLNSLAQRGPRDQAGSLGGGSRRHRGEGDLGAVPQWECRGQGPRWGMWGAKPPPHEDGVFMRSGVSAQCTSLLVLYYAREIIQACKDARVGCR